MRVYPLLQTATVTIRDLDCDGKCTPTGEEWSADTHLVFPYRGLFIRHVGRDQAVAEANQVLFFNGAETYRVSHPIPGGDACLDVRFDEEVLRELAPPSLVRQPSTTAFKPMRLRIDQRAQAMVASLRHGLGHGVADGLEGENLALSLARQALGSGAAHVPGGGAGRQRLADRVKLVLASDLNRRWTLGEIARAVGHSAVYLTQVFQEVEGLPLYRYHLRLRLARALHLIPQYDDLTSLALDLGFSSHSHFTSMFSHVYGRAPSAFKRTGRRH